jgi:MFS family permease
MGSCRNSLAWAISRHEGPVNSPAGRYAEHLMPAEPEGSRTADGMAPGTRHRSRDDRYQWVALANTTAAVFMSALDGSIVIISLPAIFRGIGLDPLAASNVVYLLWMIMGYRLVQAVLVVTFGRLGDLFDRVRIYNAGFLVFTVASVLLSFDPFSGSRGALWLIGWRVLQAVGGAMLTANSAAILTDAFPSDRRGFALGVNQIAGLGGQFIGLVAGGALAALDWRAVFWVNVPVGVFGTLWAYLRLRDNGERHRARVDWWGNITFAVGLGAVLVAITNGIQPYGGHTMGWTNPSVFGLKASRVSLSWSRLAKSLGAMTFFWMMEKKISRFSQDACTGVWIMMAFGWASRSRLIAAWPRWSEPLSTMTNTRGASV